MIKFLDLDKINARHAIELKKIASEVIDSGWYLLGDRTKQFESDLSTYIGSKHVIACANGLDALRIILRSYIEMGYMNVGDEIIVPANTFIATVLAITDNGLKPVFAEPEERGYNLNLDNIENLINEKTKAIIVVHLYGLICWSNGLVEISNRYKLKVIEDNAQAIGARWRDGTISGNLGHAAGLSFYPGKNLGALGDGGAIVTSDDQLAEIARAIANYGSSKKYITEFRGLNSRLDEIQAAFLSQKLRFLDTDNKARRKIACYYLSEIKNKKIVLPICSNEDQNSNVWHLFVIRTKERDSLQNYLLAKGIQTIIHYPIPPHKQLCYSEYNKLSLPITESLANEVLSLPISQVMDPEQIKYIVDTINRW